MYALPLFLKDSRIADIFLLCAWPVEPNLSSFAIG